MPPEEAAETPRAADSVAQEAVLWNTLVLFSAFCSSGPCADFVFFVGHILFSLFSNLRNASNGPGSLHPEFGQILALHEQHKEAAGL